MFPFSISCSTFLHFSFIVLDPPQTAEEVSNLVYLQILSEKADSKVTLRKVLANLQKVFVTGVRLKWLIVVGDAKTYDLLQDLHKMYGTHLKWLIPFPGDWHVLFNYQKVIMKVYAAGLVHLAKASGHRSETLTSLINCSTSRGHTNSSSRPF